MATLTEIKSEYEWLVTLHRHEDSILGSLTRLRMYHLREDYAILGGNLQDLPLPPQSVELRKWTDEELSVLDQSPTVLSAIAALPSRRAIEVKNEWKNRRRLKKRARERSEYWAKRAKPNE